MSTDGRAKPRRGLGMGLSALLGGTTESYAGDATAPPRRVPIEFLMPSPVQPRRRFTEADLAALAQSVRELGVLQPLLVRPAAPGAVGYEIIAGERRWRAAQRAGLHEVPVVVRELSDGEALEVALIENLQRADLSPLEEGAAYQRLIAEFAHTQERLAEVVGRSRSHIANTIRLLALPELVRAMLEEGRLSAGHARALVGRSDAAALARLVVERDLNVRQTEALVRQQAAGPRARARAVVGDPNVEELGRRLTERLGVEVRVRPRRAGGVLTIRYSDLDQLHRLIERL